MFAVETMNNGQDELRKALSAGYGTDAAQFEGGRALQMESLELTLINAMREQPEDAKLLNRIKRRPVSSTVHQYNVRDDAGDYENLTASEGGSSAETSQDIKRITKEVKYIQTYRVVTDQMLAVDSLENAMASEKLAGTLTVMKGAERLLWHGDSSVVPTEFDGVPKMVRDGRGKSANVKDLRGASIGSTGRAFFDDMAGMIYERGGMANGMYFPPILAKDIQELAVGDAMRFVGNASFKETGAAFTAVVDHITTPYGNTISFGGKDFGPDKFYRPRGVVSANGDVQKRPAAPASVVLSAQAGVAGSLFVAADAGDYTYAVHSVNKYGISEATAPAAAATVASGGAAQITIAPSSTGLETGYIITRSNKGGTQVMEMARVGKDPLNANTVVVDKNESLPGTADAVFLTEQRLQPVLELFQLIPLRFRPLYESNFAGKPFFIQFFCVPDLKVPQFSGIVTNIAYSGGLY
jgi:hypothetical protein